MNNEDFSALVLITLSVLLPIFASITLRKPLHQWLRKNKLKVDVESNGWSDFFGYLPIGILSVFQIATFLTILNHRVAPEKEFVNSLGGLFIILTFTAANTYTLLRYFKPPKETYDEKDYSKDFITNLGHVVVYVNMMLMMCFWNAFFYYFLKLTLSDILSANTLIGFVVMIVILSAIFYFPSRMFYLPFDRNQRTSILFIILASLPLLIKAIVETFFAR